MTAVASSVAPIVSDELKNTILNLPEDAFWKIVAARLNLPTSQQQKQDQTIIMDANEESSSSRIEYWTEEYLIDKLALRLAGTKQTIIIDNHKTITIHKYYHQALSLRKWIPISKPAPEFIINMSDLTPQIIAQLKTLDDPKYVLKSAVGRIFENIDSRQYHLSIARKLKVRFDK